MSNIIVPQRRVWTRQPDQAIALDKNNLYGRAVITGVCGGMGPDVGITGRFLTKSNAFRSPQAVRFDGVPGNCVDYGLIQPSKAFAIVAKIRKPTNHAYVSPLFDNKSSPDWDNNVGFAFIGARGDNGTLFYVGSSQIYTASGAFGDLKYHTLSAIFVPGAVQDFYVDGVKPAYTSAIASGYNAVSRSLKTGTYYDQSAGRSGAQYIEYAYLLDGAWSPEQLDKLHRAPYQVFARRDRRISIVIDSGGTIYTISPTGSLSLLGSVIQLHERSLTPLGSLALTGTNLITFTNGATTYTIIPSGSVTLSGTNETNRYHLLIPQGNISLSGNAVERRVRSVLPTGSIDFEGDTTIAEVKIFAPNGTITFNGTAQLYMPGMEIESTKLPLTGVGS